MISLVNLNKDKPKHHNVGISSLKDGHGIIFNGKQWVSEKNNVITDTLIESKEKDVTHILDEVTNNEEIKDLLGEDGEKLRKEVQNEITETQVNPKNRKLLKSHIKTLLHNNSHYAINAKKATTKLNNNSDKEISANEIKTLDEPMRRNFLKDGVTLEEFKLAFNKSKQKEENLKLQKEITNLIMNIYVENDVMSREEFNVINKTINQMTTSDAVKQLLRVIIPRIITKEPLTDEFINGKLHENSVIDNFMN